MKREAIVSKALSVVICRRKYKVRYVNYSKSGQWKSNYILLKNFSDRSYYLVVKERSRLCWATTFHTIVLFDYLYIEKEYFLPISAMDAAVYSQRMP